MRALTGTVSPSTWSTWSRPEAPYSRAGSAGVSVVVCSASQEGSRDSLAITQHKPCASCSTALQFLASVVVDRLPRSQNHPSCQLLRLPGEMTVCLGKTVVNVPSPLFSPEFSPVRGVSPVRVSRLQQCLITDFSQFAPSSSESSGPPR